MTRDRTTSTTSSTPTTTTTTTTTKDPSPALPSALLPFALRPRLDVAYVPEFVTQQEEEALLRHLRPPPPPRAYPPSSSSADDGAETTTTTTAAAATATATATTAPFPGWRVVSGRRVRALGGAVQGGALTAAPLPSFVAPLLEKLRETGAFRERGSEKGGGDGGGGGGGGGDEKDETEKNDDEKNFPPPPNHVLINSYSPGEGIMPHEDGPLYHPCAAIVSLGSWAVLRFYAKRGGGEGEGEADGEEGEGEGEEELRGRRSSVFSVALAPRSLVVFAGAAYKSMLHGIEAVEEEVLDASVLNFDNGDDDDVVDDDIDDDEGKGRERRRRRRQRDEQVASAAPAAAAAAAAAAASPRGGERKRDVIPRGTRGLGATSDERLSLTVRRVIRVRRNLLSRLGPRV